MSWTADPGPQTIDRTLGTRVELAIAAERRAFARSTAVRRREAGVLEVAGGCAVYTGDGLFSNRALALGLTAPIDDVDLDQIERFYASRDKRTEIELASLASPQLISRLSERGYQLRRFRHIFARSCRQPAPRADHGVEVEIVDDSNRDEWLSVLIEGFGYDDAGSIERVGEWNDALLATPGITALIGRRDGKAVGSASVLVDSSTAVLGGATTIPRHRRRGVHLTLIAARLGLAAAAGCDLAVVTTDPGSTSARNSERSGFRLVCTHAVMAGPAPTG